MKTLTVKQPWASLIVSGIKDIENRTWKTDFRGRVLVHAGSSRGSKFKISLTDKQMIAAFGSIAKDSISGNFEFGAIIGSVEIVDCVINHSSIWAERHSPPFKPYNWVLANPIKFPEPIPVKGKLGFWDFDYSK